MRRNLPLCAGQSGQKRRNGCQTKFECIFWLPSHGDQPRSLRPEGGKWGCNKLSFGVRRRAMEPRPVRRDCENAFEEIVSSCDVPHSMTVTVPSSMWGRICKILVVNGNVSARRLLRARNTTIFSRCLARFCWKLMLLSIVMSTSKPVSLAFSSNTPFWIPAHQSVDRFYFVPDQAST